MRIKLNSTWYIGLIEHVFIYTLSKNSTKGKDYTLQAHKG